jgi:glutamyl-tRNA synthetase
VLQTQDRNRDNIYRFAPSPSGYLHVGGARTAIFNWLLAQHTGGKFILRIEDTDIKRSNEESVVQILNSLQWLGLTWEEEPIFQSSRLTRHLDIIAKLVDSKKAYRCFCAKNETDQKRVSRYGGVCRNLSDGIVAKNLSSGQPYTIRIKIPDGVTTYQDLIHGPITIDNKEVDDFIIMRSDGMPVYNLAVMVDDHDMGVTHVIRGDDHIANTPKQIHLYQALGWPVPGFGHLPLILGTDRKRLSKRHGAASVEELRNQGILREALFNYLCLLGWSPGDDRELFTRGELIKYFSLKRVKSVNAVFDYEKLRWMNAKYLSDMSAKKLFALIKDRFTIPMDVEDQKILYLIDLVKIRVETLNDLERGTRFLYENPETYEEAGINKYFAKGNPLQLLQGLRTLLEKQSDFSVEVLESLVRTYAADSGISAAKIIHPLRLALTGKTTSPGIFDVMYVLGKNKVLERIENALLFIEAMTLTLEEKNP